MNVSKSISTVLSDVKENGRELNKQLFELRRRLLDNLVQRPSLGEASCNFKISFIRELALIAEAREFCNVWMISNSKQCEKFTQTNTQVISCTITLDGD